MNAWEILVKLFNEATLINLTTGLGETNYKNMVITSLSAPRSASIGKSLVFEMEMQQVRISDLTVQDFDPPDDAPTEDRPSDDESRGDIGATDSDVDPPPPTGGGGGGGVGDHHYHYDRDGDGGVGDLGDRLEETVRDDDDGGQRGEDFGTGVSRIIAGQGILVFPQEGTGQVSCTRPR